VFNNWIYSGIFNAHTGRPFNLTLNNDTALDDEPNQRPYLVPGISPYLPKNRHRTAKLQEYFNTAAFAYPALGTFGNLPRNALTGPGYLLTSMTIARSFPLSHVREGMRFLFRAEAFNVWNTPNLANPAGGYSCSSATSYQVPCLTASATNSINTTFGRIQSTFGSNGNTSTNGRKMQFSGTIYF
jgi:hypothetical protein